ncbi:MBL fold metallo-hydrolase [Parasphingopyxis algicola]|uniref:MBL fold metallo-hydrolase n=1 Tax=Parasphingopyxis algicola TaxID=2026624 RepID=UPI0015A1F7EC|nr:MBL fold metallo-hydrolase [Parasphingopyxis algicola]QLC24559.1 MBL fold metallo-hydrolase [Parasphingopyxis algicola]
MRAAPFTIGLLAMTLAIAGCSGRETETAEGPEAEATAELEIHRPFRRGPGSVNSYWIEGPDEILVFDTQRSIALAERVVAAIEATGKPVTAIVISHYDPDHFGGLQAFTDAFPDAELLMAENVAEQIGRDLSGYVERLRETQGDEYRAPPEPTRFIEHREELTVSNVPIVVHVLTDTEAETMAMLAIPSERAVLASDLVANRMHPDVVDADIDSWPRALNRLTRDFSGFTLYPGHGEPGPVNLLAANQIAYLSFVRGRVEREILADDVATEEEINAAISAIRANYPDWENVTGRPAQLRRNLEAIVAQLGGELESEQEEDGEAEVVEG